MTTTKEESIKKEKIARTFEKHFKHYGFKKTSVDDIAKELKMSKKTIYSLFSTKEKIFYYVISNIARKLSQNMGKKLKDLSTSKEKIDRLVDLIFQETRKWIKQGNDAFEFKYKFEIAGQAFREAYNVLFEKLITQGNENREFKVDNVLLKLRFINGIFTESIKLLQANPNLHLEEEVKSSIQKILS